MEKLKTYFKNIGFAGNDLDEILNAFTLKTYKKGDYFVEEGRKSKRLMSLLKIPSFRLL
jgi:hypothetical protein